jgi:hypothetical protein
MTKTETGGPVHDGMAAPIPGAQRTMDNEVTLVILKSGAIVRVSESIEQILTAIAYDKAVWLRVSDPGDERPKAIPVENIDYIDTEFDG